MKAFQAILGGLLSALCLAQASPGHAQAVREQRPTVISVDLGFPKGLGLSVMHNLKPEWAVGASASHVLLWPSLGLFGRYYLEPEKSHHTGFAEWRVFHHPGVRPGAYVLAPHWSTHLLYGWESRSPEGFYSHMAFGMGLGNSTNEGMLLGFVNLEVAFGGSLAFEPKAQ